MSVIRVSRCGITRGTLSGQHVLTLIWMIMTGGSFKIVSNWAVLTAGMPARRRWWRGGGPQGRRRGWRHGGVRRWVVAMNAREVFDRTARYSATAHRAARGVGSAGDEARRPVICSLLSAT